MTTGMLDTGRMSERIEAWLRDQGHAARVRSYELMTGGYSRAMARLARHGR